MWIHAPSINTEDKAEKTSLATIESEQMFMSGLFLFFILFCFRAGVITFIYRLAKAAGIAVIMFGFSRLDPLFCLGLQVPGQIPSKSSVHRVPYVYLEKGYKEMRSLFFVRSEPGLWAQRSLRFSLCRQQASVRIV